MITGILSAIHIEYQPGFGGNFLTLLMSLDPITVPYIHRTNDVFERLKFYNFNNSKKFDHWAQFHRNYHGSYFIDKSNPQILITRSHWGYTDFADYAVDLSYDDFPNYWLISTRERWRQFPVLMPGDFDIEINKRSLLSYKNISLDSFLYRDFWKDEYLRICNLMNLPVQMKAAEILYNSWYQIRVAPLAEDFKKLSISEKLSYYHKRKDQELNPPKNRWNHSIPFKEAFYLLRGDGWPECSSEEDFDNFPDFVKKELIEKFGYIPK